MGSGKSSVGALAADRAGVDFHDLDRIIEAETGMSIGELFEQETRFRVVESRLLPKALQPGAVASLGGGAPMQDENWALIRERATTVWLEAPFAVLYERIRHQEHRPLVRYFPEADLEALYQQRRPRYAEADHRLDATRPVAELAEEVLSLWSG